MFNKTVRKEPAKVEPMTMEVDIKKWQSYKNSGPPRPQTLKKEMEIERQVKELLDLGVIEISDAAHYSQVNMVPKPDDKWRFCLDFRWLND